MIIFKYRLMINDRKDFVVRDQCILFSASNELTWNTHAWSGIGDDSELATSLFVKQWDSFTSAKLTII